MRDHNTLRRLVDLLQGTDVRYPLDDGADTHPLVGAFTPDFTLTIQGGEQRVAGLMRRGRGVLLDFNGGELSDQASSWSDRIEIVGATTVSPPAAGILIRPDGYVAWAGSTTDTLDQALRRWFGAPAFRSSRARVRWTPLASS